MNYNKPIVVPSPHLVRLESQLFATDEVQWIGKYTTYRLRCFQIPFKRFKQLSWKAV